MTVPGWRISRKRLIAVGVFVVLALAVGLGVSSQPAICGACHTAQARALSESPHEGVACYACHLQAGAWSLIEAKGTETLAMYPSYIIGRRVSGAGTRISRGSCVACHADLDQALPATGEMLITHSSCAPPPVKCDTCHSEDAHPGAVRWTRKSDMDACVACHVTAEATLDCEVCHSGEPPRGLGGGTLAVTHGPGWRQTHGMADLRTCSLCHDDRACIECHGTRLPHPVSFLNGHGEESLEPEAKCDTCHHGGQVCDSCHGIPMPHPVDFRPQHTTLAESWTDPRCMKCHRDVDCLNCHVGHAHPGSTNGWIGTTPGVKRP